MIMRVCFVSMVAITMGLRMERSIPRDDSKSLHKENHESMSRFYEDLGVTAAVRARIDPFTTGNKKLWLVSVETRNRNSEDFEKGMQKGYSNIYGDLIAAGFNTSKVPRAPLKAKARILKEWSVKQAEKYPEELVLFLDRDTAYLGCSEDQFLKDVDEIFAHSQADLILGAELHCAIRTVWKDSAYHCQMAPGRQGKSQQILALERYLRQHGDKRGKDSNFMQQLVYPEVPDWAKSLYNVDNTSFEGYSQRNQTRNGRQAENEARFLNSGLMVGKAKHFMKIFEWIDRGVTAPGTGGYESPFGGNWWNDQHAFNMAYYDTVDGNTDVTACNQTCSGVKITLDFGARLIFNLYGVRAESPPFETISAGDYKSKVSGKPVCFIHGNGKGESKGILYKVAYEIENTRPDLLRTNFRSEPLLE